LLRRGLFPAHAAGGVTFRRLALVSGLHQFDKGFTREHVDLKLAAAQLTPKMLAQRLLADAKLIGDFGLCDAESRSPLDEGALVCGRLLWGVMGAIAKALSTQDSADVAAYFAARPTGLTAIARRGSQREGQPKDSDSARRLAFIVQAATGSV
jgi:hypothetical protein